MSVGQNGYPPCTCLRAARALTAARAAQEFGKRAAHPERPGPAINSLRRQCAASWVLALMRALTCRMLRWSDCGHAKNPTMGLRAIDQRRDHDCGVVGLAGHDDRVADEVQLMARHAMGEVGQVAG